MITPRSCELQIQALENRRRLFYCLDSRNRLRQIEEALLCKSSIFSFRKGLYGLVQPNASPERATVPRQIQRSNRRSGVAQVHRYAFACIPQVEVGSLL